MLIRTKPTTPLQIFFISTLNYHVIFQNMLDPDDICTSRGAVGGHGWVKSRRNEWGGNPCSGGDEDEDEEGMPTLQASHQATASAATAAAAAAVGPGWVQNRCIKPENKQITWQPEQHAGMQGGRGGRNLGGMSWSAGQLNPRRWWLIWLIQNDAKKPKNSRNPGAWVLYLLPVVVGQEPWQLKFTT